MRRVLVSSLLFAAGCGASLPQPRQAAPAPDSFIEVPYPPPAALSELIPKRPRGDVVFQDGGWTWRGRYFVWQRGGWVAPGALRFCPWAFHYLDDGRAMFSPSHWVDARGVPVRPPVILVPSITPPNEVTAEFQTGR
ncbi:MAG TPA: hypothetical protein VMI54_18095 [Polyangiaceae bacterium]|nr:hypothetical protein [Polyangiaceae bacterium]